jgi:CRP-like cAMP-binding protein
MDKVKKETIPAPKENEAPVDKIRELLFGSQMENYEQHFQRLESMIIAETKRATDEMIKRLAAVETLLNQRLEKSEQALEREQKERIATVNAVNEATKNAFLQLNNRLDSFDSATNRNLTDIKDALDYESQNLASQIKALRDELTQSLQDESGRLDRQKVNRQQLADMLAGISHELNRS